MYLGAINADVSYRQKKLYSDKMHIFWNYIPIKCSFYLVKQASRSFTKASLSKCCPMKTSFCMRSP